MLYKKISLFILLCIFSDNVFSQDIGRGIKLIKNERYTEAKKYFTSLTTTKSAADAYFYLGEICFINEKPDSAKLFYQKGIEAQKNNPVNFAGLSKIYRIQKNNSLASINEEEALDLGNDDPQVYITIAEGYDHPEVKNPVKALELLNEALKKEPGYVPVHIALGKHYFAEKNGTEAAKNFENAIDLNPTNSEAMTLKAKIYLLVNNTNGAVSLLNEAIANDVEYSPAYYEMAELYSTIKDYAKASEYYGKYIEASEITPDKRRRYASILYLNKEYNKVVNILEDVIKTEPENPAAVRMLAYSFLRLKETEKSMSYFKKLFEMPSVEYLATDYENYADLLNDAGNDSLSIDYLYKVFEADSTRKDIFSKISVKCFQKKDWDCVITALNKKSNLTAQEYFDIGKAYYFIEDYRNADTSFGMLISKVPELAVAHFWKARVRTNFDPESDFGLAKPYYEQFISLSKEDSSKFKKELIEAYSYLGYYKYLKTENEISRLYWEKVYALDPENKQAIEALKNIK